jgi:hypothetical protein
VANVLPRKVPHHLPNDPALSIKVVVGADKPVGGGERTGRPNNVTVQLYYPALVIVYREGQSSTPRSDDFMEIARYWLRRLLWTYNLIPGTTCGCAYDSDPPFSRESYPNGADVSAQLFTYKTEEPQRA